MLETAVNSNNLKLIQNFLEEDPYDVLTTAIRVGNLHVVKYIIKYGISFYMANNALVTASENGKLDIVKYLVKILRTKYFLNDRPIHWIKAMYEACTFGHINIIKYFISIGLCPDKECISRAYINNHINTVKYLVLMVSTDIYMDGNILGQYGHLEIIKYLVQKKIKFSEEILMSAIEYVILKL